MKLIAFAVVAALAATPALAADDTANPTPSAKVDGETAAKDTARQDYYQDKLDAANAQTKADNEQARAEDAQAKADQAASDRDAALDKAAQDRADARAANP